MQISANMVEVHIARKTEEGLQFLALKRSPDDKYPNIWQMVTGKIEKDEKAHNAARREVREETGIDGGELYVVPNVSTFYDHYSDTLRHVVVFLILMKSDSAEVRLSGEHSDYRWVNAEGAKSLFVWTDQRRSVDAILHLLDNPDAAIISKIIG